jgi:hypothetical protein
MSAPPQSLEVTLEVVSALDEVGAPYHVGGSFASAIHGLPRHTRDVDIVADLRAGQVDGFMTRLGGRFYLDRDAVLDAIRRGSSFNLIHLGSGFKVDVFIKGGDEYDLVEFERCRQQRVLEDPPLELLVKSPEDTILRKLQWYREAGCASDRQWSDILGVLKVQGERLDLGYLRHWAPRLGLAHLLERALTEAW